MPQDANLLERILDEISAAQIRALRLLDRNLSDSIQLSTLAKTKTLTTLFVLVVLREHDLAENGLFQHAQPLEALGGRHAIPR